jgi:hypothetical protein
LLSCSPPACNSGEQQQKAEDITHPKAAAAAAAANRKGHVAQRLHRAHLSIFCKRFICRFDIAAGARGSSAGAVSLSAGCSMVPTALPDSRQKRIEA